MIFRPISADFDFWKFWPTNENFEIYENPSFSEFGSKSRMRTSDSALESSNIIFFDLEILGTTWVPSGWPICTWNKPKTSFFGKTHKWLVFVHRITAWYPKISKFLWSRSMMSQLSKTVSTVVVRLLDRFLSSFEISSKSHDFHNSGF